MTLMELLERFVAAHEKQAEAAMLMAQGQPAQLTRCGEPDGTECTAGKPAGHMMAMQCGGTAHEDKPLPDWNPYTEKVQGKYGKDKQEIMDALLKERGIEMKANATGAEKHQALLDHGNSDTPPAAPPVEQPPVDPKPEAPAEPEITLEALKSAAGLYCARRKVAGSEAPAGDCAALLQAHAGVGKTAEVPADKRKACLDAFEANWMPQEDDL